MSILEQTVSELEESSIMKDVHIEKLLLKNEMFLKEVTQREDELNETIKQQEELITRANNEIYTLKMLQDRTRSDIEYPPEAKKNETLAIVRETLGNIGNMSTAISEVNHRELIPIPKILILCDEIGYGLRKSMSKSIGEEFTIETIIKPGAYFVNVIEDVVELSMNFGLNDYIIVIAGSNDFNSKKYPSFREINSRIKECSHTNIIFSSVPYGKQVKLNDFIYKFNIKLNEYTYKLNHYAEGDIFFIDLNCTKGTMQSKRKSSKKSQISYLEINKQKFEISTVMNETIQGFLDPSMETLKKV
ncbi:hypothetical protein JTB14_031540 [Gonioctena quinquepunctata]|nr:hypothetical protein JTB14_031540 [Gonioctena quinquepunctata]